MSVTNDLVLRPLIQNALAPIPTTAQPTGESTASRSASALSSASSVPRPATAPPTQADFEQLGHDISILRPENQQIRSARCVGSLAGIVVAVLDGLITTGAFAIGGPITAALVCTLTTGCACKVVYSIIKNELSTIPLQDKLLETFKKQYELKSRMEVTHEYGKVLLRNPSTLENLRIFSKLSEGMFSAKPDYEYWDQFRNNYLTLESQTEQLQKRIASKNDPILNETIALAQTMLTGMGELCEAINKANNDPVSRALDGARREECRLEDEPLNV